MSRRKPRERRASAASGRARRWFVDPRLLLLLAAAFAARLAVLYQLADHPLLRPEAGLDTTVYVQLARDVVAGNTWLGPGLYFVSPLYIYVVASILKIAGGSLFWVRVVQIGLGTLAILLLFRMADVWHGRRAAWFAGVLAAFTGLFTFYEVLLLQAAIDPILTTAALSCLTAALIRDRAVWFVATGAVFGLHAMNRPNVLVAAAGIGLVLLAARRWRSAGLLAAGVALALLPLTIRNYAVAGDLSPLSSHGGLNFYIGNNPQADGTYRMVDGITPSIRGQKEDARRVAEQAIGRPLSDSDVSAHFYDLAWKWIRAEPAAAARLMVRKLAYTINAVALPLNYSYAYYSRDEATLLRYLPVGPWLILPLGLAGLWLAAPDDPARRRLFFIWASFVPFYALAVAAFFVSSRYRLPLVVALVVPAAGAIDRLLGLVASGFSRTDAVSGFPPSREALPRTRRGLAEAGSRTSLVVAVPLLAGLAVFTNWRFGLDDGREEERIRMAIVLIDQERFGEAEARAADIARESREPGILHFRIGRALMLKGQAGAAVRHLEQAIALDPDRPENSFAYGQALLDAGRASDAVPHLRRAYEARVRVDLAGYDLARALAMTGDRPGAIRILQQLRPARAEDAASWFALGQLAMDLEAPRVAEAFARRTLQAQPERAAAHQQLGLALASQGRFDEALRSLEEARRLAPADPTVHLNVAVALAELGRVDEARSRAAEALRLRPDYEKARQFLTALAK